MKPRDYLCQRNFAHMCTKLDDLVVQTRRGAQLRTEKRVSVRFGRTGRERKRERNRASSRPQAGQLMRTKNDEASRCSLIKLTSTRSVRASSRTRVVAMRYYCSKRRRSRMLSLFLSGLRNNCAFTKEEDLDASRYGCLSQCLTGIWQSVTYFIKAKVSSDVQSKWYTEFSKLNMEKCSRN